MAETWGNGHYSCFGCKYESSKDAFSCKRCLTYTPLMKPYYQNWTKKEMSNADKIRSMSDEELAEFFARKSPCDYYCNYSKRACNGVSCKQGILEWLKSPTND